MIKLISPLIEELENSFMGINFFDAQNYVDFYGLDCTFSEIDCTFSKNALNTIESIIVIQIFMMVNTFSPKLSEPLDLGEKVLTLQRKYKLRCKQYTLSLGLNCSFANH